MDFCCNKSQREIHSWFIPWSFQLPLKWLSGKWVHLSELLACSAFLYTWSGLAFLWLICLRLTAAKKPTGITSRIDTLVGNPYFHSEICLCSLFQGLICKLNDLKLRFSGWKRRGYIESFSSFFPKDFVLLSALGLESHKQLTSVGFFHSPPIPKVLKCFMSLTPL